jgi:hypothetical protein
MNSVDGGDGMITTLDVLSVGPLNSNNFVRDVLLSRTKCRLFAVASVWDLSAILAPGEVDVAILHDTLSPGELRSCAVYIRHHWPAAKILLIHAQVDILDDPMYDERMSPDLSAETLLSMIERLAASSRRSGRSVLSDEHNQH